MSRIKSDYVDMLQRRVRVYNIPLHRGVGAPSGGRVHWLLWHLSPEFKGKYNLLYDYKFHNYVFVRYEKRRLYDIFIVLRTSVHAWRCVYFNADLMAFERCSTRKSADMARCLMLIEKAYRKETFPKEE